MKTFNYNAVWLGLAVVLTCTLTSCTPSALRTTAGQSLEFTEQVVSNDSAITGGVRVAKHRARRINGDLLQVDLGLENVRFGKKDLWVDIQVVFYDADHFELERTNWQPLLVKGGQVTYFSTSSLSSAASDYTIFLDNGRESAAR